jgi:uncharacterized repeat protein (TIGR03833 family)
VAGTRVMAKKPTDGSATNTGTLTHSPFAALANKELVRVPTPAREQSTPAVVRGPAPTRARAVRLRQESKGRSGKVVTRITGLPSQNLEAIGSRLRKALGCGAVVEGDELVLLGSLADRARQWLDAAGDPREIKEERAIERAPRPPEPAIVETTSAAAVDAGSRRSDVRRGQRVAIVLKADQASGKLTEGVVRDILTSSPTHPRGIKVRLETGEVGRVKLTYP